MRIALNILVINWQDIKNPFGGGAEVHLHEIFKRVVARGHNVTLLACGFDDAPENETIDGINVIRAGKRNTFNFVVPKEYKKLSKKEKFDIVIDDINKIPFYTPIYVKEPLLAISHHFFGKSIFREAGLIAGLYVYLSEKLLDFLYKKTPFAVVSESTKNEFKERGFDTSQFAVIQNAIDKSQFNFKIENKETVPTVAYFGRLKKYKSVDHLLSAFAVVKKSVPEAKLWILGKGDFKPNLEKLAQELGIADDTVFFGFVSDEQKAKLLARAHCVVNTSMKEGWGITNIEANACGTPVISADVPGLRDSVKNGESGLLYQYANINELAENIKNLFLDEKLRINLSEGAINWAKLFDWETSAEEMTDYCRNIIKKHKKNINK